MRSKIGTKSRLAAHLLALVLLILMLVYLAPASRPPEELKTRKPSVATRKQSPVPSQSDKAPERAQPDGDLKNAAPLARHAPPGKSDTLDRSYTPVVATHTPAAQLRPPGAEGAAAPDVASAPGITSGQPLHSETLNESADVVPHTEALRPPEKADSESASTEEPEELPASEDASVPPAATESNGPEAPMEETPLEDPVVAPASEPAAATVAEETAQPENEAEKIEHLEQEPLREKIEGESVEVDRGADEKDAESFPGDLPAAAQPDESGSLVVAAPETGFSAPVAATTPLPNANLEVLGDGVFWLDPHHDLEKELAAIPEIGTLVLLAPLPGYRVSGFEHVKTEVIPADTADINHDSAEHFLHVTEDMKRPLVIAPLSGARGAAFFKGVYLLANRNLSIDDVLREIGSELDQAGEAREEIVHRLLRQSGVSGE